MLSSFPQGSVLGPLLYLIYVNDIGHNLCNSNIVLFADDTVLIQSGYNPNDVLVALENDLRVLAGYFHDIKLKLNASKTKIMHFDNKVRGNSTIVPLNK